LASHRLPLTPKDDGLYDCHCRDNHGAHGSGNGESINLHGLIRQGAESRRCGNMMPGPEAILSTEKDSSAKDGTTRLARCHDRDGSSRLGQESSPEFLTAPRSEPRPDYTGLAVPDNILPTLTPPHTGESYARKPSPGSIPQAHRTQQHCHITNITPPPSSSSQPHLPNNHSQRLPE
jgi:hypothetical protein